MLPGCSRDLTTPKGVVQEFVDQHYVHIDLQKAKQYCVGLALHKINEEIRLTAGQVIDESTHKPKIYYRLLKEKVGSDRASFLFEGTIRVENDEDFQRRWLIMAKKDGTQWRVSNYTDYPDV